MKLIYFPNKVLNKYYSYRSSKLNGSIDEYITDLTEKGLIS